MRSLTVLYLIVVTLLLRTCWCSPTFYHGPEPHTLAVVSELTSRLESRAQEARLPIPTPQDIETIKKVAQILIMIGEQVIPTIIGETPSGNCDSPAADYPSDAINENNK
ncbi:unnamed protein product [Diatraea saccharalis]|uniref:Uncharacterized protein n=1 Tax=Diatraea saccharalis TaxID=40085 RepID=A0A9N9R4B9_9NEOP|nr:unnamed protein product [Diatraea saccharalis]